jgi:NADH dehydrogenase FAD-containing subunit
MRKRVVIAGLGDTGLLVALALHPEFQVIGISPKPCLVSGQELGARLARPAEWRENYLIDFGRYRKLSGMATRHGHVTRIEPERRQVVVRLHDGTEETIDYDALVLSMGVSNGFWRTSELELREDVDGRIDDVASELAKATSIAVIGGGASAVSAASNLKETYPRKRVTLFFGQPEILPGYHPKVRKAVAGRLERQGVELKPGHRAVIPAGFSGERLTHEPVAFSSGQPPIEADAVVWAVGRQRPNTDFVPASMLDEHGYVRADAQLRVPGFANVFTVGDVAATDPNRSSARNSGFLTVAHNVRALLEGRPARMKSFVATPHRWGSVLGIQHDGMRVFAPNGFSVRIGMFWVKNVLYPLIVRRIIYKGIDAR